MYLYFIIYQHNIENIPLKTNEIQTKTCSILFKVFKLNVSLVMTFYNLKKKRKAI